jgi:hypothetical protein
MSRNIRIYLCCAVLAIALVHPSPALSQVNSNQASVVLTATLLESITVLAVPSAVNFNLTAGAVAGGSTPVSMTTAWVLSPLRSSLKLYGSFSSATAALTDGDGDDIPSADVLGQVTTGSPVNFTAFTQTVPFGAAGAGLLLFSQPISTANLTGTRTDNLNLEINLTTLTIPAGVYTGTLQIQAQAL